RAKAPLAVMWATRVGGGAPVASACASSTGAAQPASSSFLIASKRFSFSVGLAMMSLSPLGGCVDPAYGTLGRRRARCCTRGAVYSRWMSERVGDPAHPRPVLVVDFGAQYAQLIARRVREANVYSEIVPHAMPVAEMLAKRPAAVILSGGPASVYADGAPNVDPALFDAGVPTLGICYGLQAMDEALGGTVKRIEGAEYGRTTATVEPRAVLFAGQPARQPVWMSHRDAVVVAPPGFAVTGATSGAEIAAFERPDRRLFGLQWHPEVMHTAHGQTMLERFLYDGAGIEPSWTAEDII